MRITTDEEKEVMIYLNELRNSGQTNMFRAGLFVTENFGISIKESNKIVGIWMRNFNESGDYETVKD